MIAIVMSDRGIERTGQEKKRTKWHANHSYIKAWWWRWSRQTTVRDGVQMTSSLRDLFFNIFNVLLVTSVIFILVFYYMSESVSHLCTYYKGRWWSTYSKLKRSHLFTYLNYSSESKKDEVHFTPNVHILTINN